jgi:hypothetical protein
VWRTAMSAYMPRGKIANVKSRKQPTRPRWIKEIRMLVACQCILFVYCLLTIPNQQIQWFWL